MTTTTHSKISINGKKPYVKYWKIELIRIRDKVGQFQKDEEYQEKELSHPITRSKEKSNINSSKKVKITFYTI